jgi:Ca-activated chloride channel homolog
MRGDYLTIRMQSFIACEGGEIMKTRRTSRVALMLTAVLFLFSSVADAGWFGAQAGNLKGKVTDTSGKAVQGATVLVVQAGLSAVTGSNGIYMIKGVASGSYTVRCSKSGYGSVSRKGVNLGEGTKTLDFKLGKKAVLKEEPEAAEEVAAEAPREMKKEDRRTRGPKKGKMSSAAGMAAPAMRPPSPSPRPDATHVVHNTESYDHIEENQFLGVKQNPLSTFSIDVDTASYANSRRYITKQNRLPPADAVRLEEFINYFNYDYPDADGKHPFAVSTELSDCPWNRDHKLVHIGLQGKKIDLSKLPNSNFVFLLDVSGSMNNANKLPLLKAALKLLVRNMRSKDRVAIVVYAGAAGLVLPSTSADNGDKIIGALDSLSAGGSTAGGAGIKLAYKIAQENFIKGGNNRIILATDGDFNVGASSDGEMTRLIEEKREDGVFLTILGFGMGNYKDSKMEKLADMGNGNAAYIDSILEAKKVLVTEMGGTLFTIAKDVKIQVEFNPLKVKAYRLVGYENRKLANEDFNDDKKDAGELGAGHTVTALYELIPAGSKEEVPGVDELKYQKTKSTAASDSNEVMTVKLRYKKPDGDKSTLLEEPVKDDHVALSKSSQNFRWSAAVAMFAMELRGSKFKGETTWKMINKLAKGAKGDDKEGYRQEFLKILEQAELLKGK